MNSAKYLPLIALALSLQGCGDAEIKRGSNCTGEVTLEAKHSCLSNKSSTERVRYSIFGALTGGVIGGAAVAIDGGDVSDGVIAGAIVGSLSGYWLSLKNEALEHAASERSQLLYLNSVSKIKLRELEAVIRDLNSELGRLKSSPVDQKSLKLAHQIKEIATEGYSLSVSRQKGFGVVEKQLLRSNSISQSYLNIAREYKEIERRASQYISSNQ